MLGLDPDSVINRIKESGNLVVLPDRRQSVMVGALGFAVVSLVVFGLWAIAGRWLTDRLGTLPFYLILAAGFMAGGPAAFGPILIGQNLRRFYILFLGSFIGYAAIWIGCWMKWGQLGEWLATILGPGLMATLFVNAFGAQKRFLLCAGGLVIGHTAGYFLGSLLFAWELLHNRFGMEVWGLFYGAGFGAGIGLALSECQAATRARLLAMSAKSSVAQPAGGEDLED